MKRIFTLLIIMVLLLSVPSIVHTAAQYSEQPAVLTVGHTTMLSGNFFSDLWGNNTADIDVRSLLHDYPIIAQTKAGDYQFNKTVVSQIEKTEIENGDTTYSISIRKGLKYSDGSPIDARDYLFSFLLFSSPQLKAITGLTPSYAHIVGFDEYNDGLAKTISGLRLINDQTFTLRIKGEYLPYFYEMVYVNANPYPISVIIPGAKVMDDGEGAYISGEITEDVLRKTILDSEEGYLSHPMVTSGPYRLLSYDSKAHVVEVEINPYYSGNYVGKIPTIPRLRFQKVNNQNIHQQMALGKIDLVNKVTDGEVIDKAIALKQKGSLRVKSYPRIGSGFLAIANERPVVSSVNVRQALAFCLDYDVLPKEFLKGHGKKVHGYYGLGQWMVNAVGVYGINQLPHYELNLKKAEELLILDGWNYDKNGDKYSKWSSGLRYRKTEDGNLEPLSFHMIITPQNKAANLIFDMLSNSLSKIGGVIFAEEIPMDQALSQYYRQEERNFDLFFLGNNFLYFFDPANTYRIGDEYQGAMNTSGLQDEKLAALAEAVTKVPSKDKDAFLKGWLEFQKYWAEVLPMIPLYSNTYYDIYTPDLEDYHPEEHGNWSTAILYASLNR